MEDKIQEIMSLADALSIECIAFGIAKMASSAENNAILGDDVKKSRALLQSKLRELVERCSVREPLSNQDAETLIRDCDYLPWGIVKAVERAHNITNTTKE